MNIKLYIFLSIILILFANYPTMGKCEMFLAVNSVFEDELLFYFQNNGELIIYKGVGILLTGLNNVGKTSFCHIALETSGDWELLTIGATMIYYSKNYQLGEKITLFGEKEEMTVVNLSTKFGKRTITLSKTKEKFTKVSFVVMFDAYYDRFLSKSNAQIIRIHDFDPTENEDGYRKLVELVKARVDEMLQAQHTFDLSI